MVGVIYKVTNKKNNKCYIGKTFQNISKRTSQHYYNSKETSRKSYFHNALKKYGKNNFEWEIIDIGNDEEELSVLERFWIWKYNSYGKDGYNLTKGGEGNYGVKHSEETKQRMSISKMGNKNPLYGKHHSVETKKILSEKKNGVYDGEKNPMYGTKGELSPNYGKKHKLNSRKKMSLKQHKKGLFGYTGVYYKEKNVKPWKRVWGLQFNYKNKVYYLGNFNDPLSGNIVYDFVWGEIYATL